MYFVRLKLNLHVLIPVSRTRSGFTDVSVLNYVSMGMILQGRGAGGAILRFRQCRVRRDCRVCQRGRNPG